MNDGNLVNHQVGLVDAYRAFLDYQNAGGKVGELMAQANHPNRKGHTLVAQGLQEWFGLER